MLGSSAIKNTVGTVTAGVGSVTSGVGEVFSGKLPFISSNQAPKFSDVSSQDAFEQVKDFNVKTNLLVERIGLISALFERFAGLFWSAIGTAIGVVVGIALGTDDKAVTDATKEVATEVGKVVGEVGKEVATEVGKEAAQVAKSAFDLPKNTFKVVGTMFSGALALTLAGFGVRQFMVRQQTEKGMDIADYHLKREAKFIGQEVERVQDKAYAEPLRQDGKAWTQAVTEQQVAEQTRIH